MTWRWHIEKGTIYHDTLRIGAGYSGFGDCANDPTKVAVKMRGPLPPGKYTIGEPYKHPKLGPVVMNLEPASTNEMFGRSLFRIHGDNSTPDPFDGSHGCIVLGPAIRKTIAASKDKALEVVE